MITLKNNPQLYYLQYGFQVVTIENRALFYQEDIEDIRNRLIKGIRREHKKGEIDYKGMLMLFSNLNVIPYNVN